MTKGLATKKIILATIILSMLFTQVILPSSATAAVLNYDHPQGNIQYTLKASDIVNPSLFMSVIGCTGIVNKIAGAITNLLADLIMTKAAKVARDQALESSKRAAVTSAVAASTLAAGTGNPAIAEGTISNYPQFAPTPVEDDQKQIDDKMTNCLNGIAIQLARNQLTAMTKATMNWITSGFNGDPFFVGEVNSFMDNLTDDIIIRETDMLKGPDSLQYYPYGRTFSQNVTSMMHRAVHTANLYAQNLTDNLILGSGDDSQDSINRFATDFSQGGGDSWSGGWGGWLALTQHPYNNPLGFTALESQKISDEQALATANAQNELNQNGGYLSQRKCIEYDKNSMTHKCLTYEIVTPGSSIRDKVAKYINSPETQLELVQTMNDALNALFTALLSKFEDQGLSSLGTTRVDFTSGGGFGSGTDNNEITSMNGSGFNGAFDLTRDIPALIKTQEDYKVVAKKSLAEVLPLVLPAVGKLDYCIPGPNPDWQSISNDTIENLNDYLSNIRIQTVKAPVGFGPVDVDVLTLPDPSIYKSIFDGTKLWATVKAIFNTPTIKTLSIMGQNVKIDTSIKLFSDNDGPLGPFKSSFGISEFMNEANNGILIKVTQENIDAKVKTWTDYISGLKPEYTKKINDLYGPKSVMQTAIDADGNIDEAGWLPMAQAGLNITKNLRTYDENITSEQKDYGDSITQASANVNKLHSIDVQVKKIVADARARRAAARAKAGEDPFPASCFDTEIIKVTDNKANTF
jgi:hypothetical protein